MGFGSSFKKAVGKVTSKVSEATGLPTGVSGALLGGALAGLTGGASLAAGVAAGAGAGTAADFLGRVNQTRQSQGLSPVTQEQISAANVFSKLTPEQQKDILINNPNIVSPAGEQVFDPLTNTITLKESAFQSAQRGRQEALASALTGSLSGTLPSIDPTTVTQATYESAKSLLDPEFTTQKSQLEQQLADQGIPVGSEAYNDAVNRLERSQGEQLKRLSLSSVQQGIQTAEAQRAARFNEISSLLGQAQVGGVGFGQFQPQRSGLDLAGIEQAGLNRQLQDVLSGRSITQAERGRRSAERSAIFGALGTLGSSALRLF